MLVLSRKRSEIIRINDDISIMIVDIRGDKVRIGVAAPKGVSIQRQEIYEAIQQETTKSAESAAPPKPATMADFVKGRAS